MAKVHPKELGSQGEKQVARYLQDQGFTILEYNYRSRRGEIDLIVHKKELVAFVEVKLRTSSYFDISQVITLRKQQNIISTAKEYLTRHNWYLSFASCRFDVALLEGVPYTLTYIEDAFRQSG